MGTASVMNCVLAPRSCPPFFLPCDSVLHFSRRWPDKLSNSSSLRRVKRNEQRWLHRLLRCLTGIAPERSNRHNGLLSARTTDILTLMYIVHSYICSYMCLSWSSLDAHTHPVVFSSSNSEAECWHAKGQRSRVRISFGANFDRSNAVKITIGRMSKSDALLLLGSGLSWTWTLTSASRHRKDQCHTSW